MTHGPKKKKDEVIPIGVMDNADERVTGRERLALGAFIGLAVPATLFVLFWWLAAVPVIYGWFPEGEAFIGWAALAGLMSGALVDIFFLARLTDAAYRLPVLVLAPLYLFWSLLTFAFLMGLPFGNMALGALAGLYVGRRARREVEAGQPVTIGVQAAARFCAVVIGTFAVPLALTALASVDGSGLDSVSHMVPIVGPMIGTETRLAIFLGLAVPGLVTVQYGLVLWAASARGEMPGRPLAGY